MEYRYLMADNGEQAALHTQESGFINRYHWLLLAGITLLAVSFRIYRLGDWSFWIDEIYTIDRAQAQYSSLVLMLRNIPPQTTWFPVSFLLIAGTINLLDISEWSVRLVPAIIGMLTIPVLYWPIKKTFGPKVALISTLLLAVSPWHIMWSQNGRFYTALMLFHTLALFAFYFGLEWNRPTYFIAALFMFYLAMSERMIAIFMLPIIPVYLTLLLVFRFLQPKGLNYRIIFILLVPVIALVLIEVHSLLSNNYLRFLGGFDVFIGNPIDSPPRILILIAFSIGLPVVVLGLFAGGWLIWQRSRSGLFFMAGAVVPIVLLVGISPWVFVVERYALITLPFWLVLTAVAIERLFTWLPRQGTWLGLGVLSLLLVHAAGDHLAYFALNNGNRLDWRGAYAYVANHKAPGDLVISDRPEIGEYYLDEPVLDLKQMNREELAALDQPAWFVVDSHGIWAVPPQSKTWMENDAELLFVWYLRVREQIDLKVYHYQPIK
jgi:mannosyltransferase